MISAAMSPNRSDLSPRAGMSKEVPLDASLKEAVQLCHESLQTDFAGFAERLHLSHKKPEDWFRLLRGLPEGPNLETLKNIRAAAEAGQEGCAPDAVARFALLQAILAAAPMIPALPVHIGVKRRFGSLFKLVARPGRSWPGKPLLDRFTDDNWPFLEMAGIVTLQRFPAGQHDWVVSGFRRSWLLRIPPLALPRLLHEVAFGLGGFRPLVRIHINRWRPNPLLLLPSEAARSYYRIARSIEMQPEIRGLIGLSWFYSKTVGEVSPHLSWLRDFFVENGGTVIEAEPAAPDSGVMIGSAKRRQTFTPGGIWPRNTFVLWRREDMLAWARNHPELAGEDRGTGD